VVVARRAGAGGGVHGRGYQLATDWYMRYVLPEGYGLLEVSHFVIPLLGLFIAASLLLLPRRPAEMI
jgi:hypothetical protein